ncbi:MAG: 50S ribosomal protein L17 [Candidatus Magasanikbacteria bacterium]|nr:50S ribosomal protein L17 [Candidatus Magasanikbacteria bacterium]
MRHRKQKITLGREAAARQALLRSLAESLILHGSIRTTRGKARALRLFVEPLVTRAKRNTLDDRRRLLAALYTDSAVRKLLSEIAPGYKDRAGGYTRVIKLGGQGARNDAAEMVRIEFV